MKLTEFQNTILDWHKKNRRDMPWRNTKDPYRILVSEVMLQQTQVSRVLLKYEEFLREFPTLETLAKAQDRKLLRVWRGLGYWKRALNLKRAAQIILRKHQGKFPKDPAVLESLPGVGPYTARAVACFAFLNKDAFLDTNIRRVYLHFFFPKRKEVADKEILKVAQKAVDRICFEKRVAFSGFSEQTRGLHYSPLEDSGRANPPKAKQFAFGPREWHYALFDYGALVLKDKRINKKSRHYTKQKKFEGSFRSFRTKVMRFLLDQPNQKATLGKIKRLLSAAQSPHPADKILSSLLKDGLVKKKRSSYSL